MFRVFDPVQDLLHPSLHFVLRHRPAVPPRIFHLPILSDGSDGLDVGLLRDGGDEELLRLRVRNVVQDREKTIW